MTHKKYLESFIDPLQTELIACERFTKESLSEPEIP